MSLAHLVGAGGFGLVLAFHRLSLENCYSQDEQKGLENCHGIPAPACDAFYNSISRILYNSIM